MSRWGCSERHCRVPVPTPAPGTPGVCYRRSLRAPGSRWMEEQLEGTAGHGSPRPPVLPTGLKTVRRPESTPNPLEIPGWSPEERKAGGRAVPGEVPYHLSPQVHLGLAGGQGGGAGVAQQDGLLGDAGGGGCRVDALGPVDELGGGRRGGQVDLEEGGRAGLARPGQGTAQPEQAQLTPSSPGMCPSPPWPLPGPPAAAHGRRSSGVGAAPHPRGEGQRQHGAPYRGLLRRGLHGAIAAGTAA